MTDLSVFLPCKRPQNIDIKGRYIRLKTIDWVEHGPDLARHITGDENASLWDFIPVGPFPDLDALQSVMSYVAIQRGWEIVALISKTGETLGTASYMRLRPEHGSAEVGCIVFGKSLQKTQAATESLYLMGQHLFGELGYRRFEWKCHNGNEASKRAAERFGFTFEGVFRQDMVMKGANRDTAWFSITDEEWPHIKSGYERWLALRILRLRDNRSNHWRHVAGR